MGEPKIDTERRYSHDEYHGLLGQSENRLEYYQGFVRAMSGGSRDHAVIMANTGRAFGNLLATKDCTVFSSELKVYAEAADAFMFPDATVVCGPEKLMKGRNDVLLNPSLIVEVLSPSTINYDLIEKFDRYTKIPSLEAYVIISQDQYRVEVRIREQAWGHQEIYKDPSQLIPLPSLGIELPLAELYRRVSWVVK